MRSEQHTMPSTSVSRVKNSSSAFCAVEGSKEILIDEDDAQKEIVVSSTEKHLLKVGLSINICDDTHHVQGDLNSIKIAKTNKLFATNEECVKELNDDLCKDYTALKITVFCYPS